MVDSQRQRDYLREVLELDPTLQPSRILQLRRRLQADATAVVAELADAEQENSEAGRRERSRQLLQSVRDHYWRLGDDELDAQLGRLIHSGHAEIATAASRLREVASCRSAMRYLVADTFLHPTFRQALAELLVAPTTQANRLRERQHRLMRPEQNPDYRAALEAIQQAAARIRDRYPSVFQVEEAWLTELLEYDPVDETEHESANLVFGLVVLGLGFGTIVFCCLIVQWIFS